MNKLLLGLFFTATLFQIQAQTNEPYEFKEYKRINCTSVKNQEQTGTCWAFSTASFLESELLRMGKPEVNLSEMFVVRNIYRLKCENYVRRQGTANLDDGGLAHDVLIAVKRYGIVPEFVYLGRKDPSKPLNHDQLQKKLTEKCKELVEKAKNGKLEANWLSQIDEILDAEFGQAPLNFKVDTTVYTPQAYCAALGINPDEYVSITSFTHHPFWEPFVLELPDNWSNGSFYNIPMDEMMQCVTNAIEKGYTVEWDTDVSNSGFSAKNNIAIVPQVDWEQKTASAKENTFVNWEPEMSITQDNRQKLFDTQVTQDDHLMHIVGVADEKHSGGYFIVKNSWGEISKLKGYLYASDAYLRLNTLSFTLPKSAIPQNIRRRLGLETGPSNIEKAQMSQQARTKSDNPNIKSTPGEPARAVPKQDKRIPIRTKE